MRRLGLLVALLGSGCVVERSLSESELDAVFPEIYCEYQERCGHGAADQACFDLERGRLRAGGFRGLRAAVESGRLDYDDEEAGNCLERLSDENVDCSVDQLALGACWGTLRGSIANGGPCALPEECAGEADCVIAEGACEGVCVARAAAGQDCTRLPCREGTHCASDGKCRADLRVGERCSGAFECGEGSRCEGGSCVAIVAAVEGEACETSRCENELSCALEGESRVCRARVGAGEACTEATPSMCPFDHFCEDAICVPAHLEGEACAEQAQCVRPFACIGERCVPHTDNGGGCESDDACYSGSCIDGVCAVPAICR